MDDLFGNQVDEDMDFFEVLLLLISLETDLYPCSFPMGFQSTGINASQHDAVWKKQALNVRQKPFIKMCHGVLNGLVAGRSFHPERRIDLQIICRVRDASVGEAEENLEEEENCEM